LTAVQLRVSVDDEGESSATTSVPSWSRSDASLAAEAEEPRLRVRGLRLVEAEPEGDEEPLWRSTPLPGSNEPPSTLTSTALRLYLERYGALDDAKTSMSSARR